ncbi:MAG: MBOAT family protein [Bacteroidales bacterium]|nr:MBOAT family protein [Clostridium sp.]MCM1203343.1 MBOAT family protein [Bacteroidales bacterium]
MIFSSLEFVCIFFPAVFLLYCLMPDIRWKNGLLIVVSLLFYAYGEPKYVLLMLFSALFNYGFARVIDVFRHKLVLLMAVAFNLGLLVFFKYADFIIGTGNRMFNLDLPVLSVRLPIGISFFTFQALSYVIDVYREKVPVQRSFWNILLYISFFPQLIAGPIVKYRDINEAIRNRKMELKQVSDGLRRFICGLGKKVLIANTVGQAADAVFNAEYADINMLVAWIGAVSYMLQIYYDFSGYSDMAIGLGKMFGFSFRENFRYPYGATTIKEFWRRWHISLSSWFKEYLYIPLGGNRKGRLRTVLNKWIVFFFTGLWHGANWTFILWGLYHGFFSMLEEILVSGKKIPKAVSYFCTMLVVCVGFVIFRAETVSQGFYLIGQMFTGISGDAGSMSFALEQLTPWFLTMLAVGIVGMAPIKPLVQKIQDVSGEDSREAGNVLVENLLYAGSVFILLWCILRLSGNTYNPFIYFRF